MRRGRWSPAIQVLGVRPCVAVVRRAGEITGSEEEPKGLLPSQHGATVRGHDGLSRASRMSPSY